MPFVLTASEEINVVSEETARALISSGDHGAQRLGTRQPVTSWMTTLRDKSSKLKSRRMITPRNFFLLQTMKREYSDNLLDQSTRSPVGDMRHNIDASRIVSRGACSVNPVLETALRRYLNKANHGKSCDPRIPCRLRGLCTFRVSSSL